MAAVELLSVTSPTNLFKVKSKIGWIGGLLSKNSKKMTYGGEINNNRGLNENSGR